MQRREDGERGVGAGERPVSGDQFVLGSGAYRAVIASIGATLRVLTHEGRDLVSSFGAEEVRPQFRGAILAPWPNRVIDGRYVFGGVEHPLAVNEPERGHAMHGLVAWLEFRPLESGSDAVLLGATIEPQEGYPFRVRLRVAYRLDASDGLEIEVRATNVGRDAAPFAAAPHPYLVAGPGAVDDWTLSLPASHVLDVTADLMTPVGVLPVDSARDFDGAADLDFRTARRVGAGRIDHAFTGLALGPDGRAEAVVRAAASPGVRAGAGVRVGWDARTGWVQVYTSDTPGPGGETRRALAVEPMTSPPGAFNSGTDLTVMEPGGSFSVGWTIAAVEADGEAEAEPERAAR